MHRELRSIEQPFARESHAGLYLFTISIAFLVGLDLWPSLASWLNRSLCWSLPLGYGQFTLFGYSARWSTLAAFLGGTRAFVSSAESFLAGRLGADLALALAVLAALLLNQPLVAAEVLLIGLIGECLEAYTFGRTQHAIRQLVDTFPRMCLVQRQGQQVMVPIDEIQIGEQITVLPGKRVPVDGVVCEGRSAIDQSNLTGESLPVDKGPGDNVLAGTVNQFGALVVRVTQVSQQTVMGQVIATTAKALQAKGKGERTADQLARYFLPVVLIIAFVTFLAHWWLLRGSGSAMYLAAAPALAVLVVACPCALILATPATTMAALARLAKTGILVKRGLALEQLASVKRFVFDKTGTLTSAQLSIGSILPLATGLTEDELLRWVASVEQQSEHPIAQALLHSARQRSLELWPVSAFEAKPGAGLIAQCQGQTIAVGSELFVRSLGISWLTPLDEIVTKLDRLGQTILFVAKNNELLGVIGIWDTIRPEAAAVVQELKTLGIEVALLSGDRESVVKQVAERLEINEARSDCLPNDKAAQIEIWKRSQRVAMVGDGVNDAPALALANVGMALNVSALAGSGNVHRIGADIAAEAGDIVLMGDPLRSLPLLVRLSRQMVTIIRQNILWFAFGVNAVGIALIAWWIPAWLDEGRQQSPLWAAVYHQIGSLLVLLNAMRLLWFERNSSSFWQKIQGVSQQCDRMLEQFSLHEMSHWIVERRKPIMRISLLLLAIAYAVTSLTIIPAGYIGLVQRCGKLLEENLSPGLHIHLPWPWDQTRQLEQDLVRRVEVGFRRVGQSTDSQTWTSLHADSMLTDPEESLLLTADGNLIEIQATLLYVITDARKYLLGSSNVETVIRANCESALRELAAQRKFEDLLAGDRSQFQQDALSLIKNRLSPSISYLGVTITALALEDLHPPQKVIQDYYSVTRAQAAKSRVITEASLDRDKNISRELVNATRVHAEATGDALSYIIRTQAERDAFLMLAMSESGMMHLFTLPAGNGLMIILPVWPATIDRDLHRKMTQYRLAIEAGETMLSQRFKVLRDPRIKGSIQIYPEALKLKLPSFGDRERPAPNPELP